MTRREAALQAHAVRRIVRAWGAATADDLAAGMSWYQRASDLADALAAGTPFSKEQCAGVIAALSPRCQWSANVRGAQRMVAAATAREPEPVVAGLRSNRSKAWRILAENADPADVLSGPKVRAFYANICGDTDRVTVDVWAAHAAEGRADKNAPKGGRYVRLERAYQLAADLLGVTPRECQAAVWTYFRRTHARAIFDLEA